MNLERAFVLIRQLQGALGGRSFSERRSVSGTMGVGVSVHALDLASTGNAFGVVITPTAHNSFSWYVHSSSGLVFNNAGASQSFTATYFAVG